MAISRYKNVVVGAGAVGMATAYQLARRGEPVLLIEQFQLGHDKGSSHGAARIIRHSYADPSYADRMPAAFRSWRILEADAAEPLILRTGGVSFSPPDVSYVAAVASNLESLGISHRRLGGVEWNRRHRVFAIPDDSDVVFEPDAGMIKAERSLQVEWELAKHLGPDTRLLDRTPIRRIDLESDRPTIVVDSGRIEADRLVVAAGAWTGRLVPSLAGDLRATRQVVFYLRPADPSRFEIGRFPAFIRIGPGDLDAFYGMPSALGLGVKVGRHGGLDVDPENPGAADIEADYAPVRAFLRSALPDLADAPIERAEVCLYTMAAGERFRLATFSGRSDVVVASPCSGHGFKFSCLIGSILADLVVDGQTDQDIGDWMTTAPGGERQ